MMDGLFRRGPARTVSALTLCGAVVMAAWGLSWSPTAQAQQAVPLFASPAAGMPQAPEIAARGYILQDLSSGQTLAARQADQAVAPASLTKLMSAYLVFQALEAGKLKVGDTLPVSERAWRAGMGGGERALLAAGSRVKVDELIKAMTVLGANDATLALAEGVAGSVDSFVAMMNRQAQVFGLTATQFRNPDGQAVSQHVSTARELSVIAAHLLTDFPRSLTYYGLNAFTFNGERQASRNLLLLRDPSVDGLQAAYTDALGYGLVATSRRTIAGSERRLLSVVVGAASAEARANESQKLLNWGYSAFDVVTLYKAGQPVGTAPVWKGQSRTVQLGRATPLVVVVPRGQAARIKATLTRNDPLMAPLGKGQTVGALQISLGTQPWQSLPLQTLEAVPSAGWLGRTWDAIRLGIK